jgi:HAD superfamily hydrolase (TIGR01509 family)
MSRTTTIIDSILFAAGTQRNVAPQDWYSEIVAGGYQAVIFDCDGTLVESSEAHFQSFRAAIRAQGHDIAESWYAQRTGLDRRSLLTAFASSISGTFDVNAASQASIEAFTNLTAKVSPIAETVTLVQKIWQSRPMAVGTNAEAEVAKASLQATNLLGYFDFIVSVSDGHAAKPAPDIFNDARRRIGFPAARTLVFEDSAEGVRAALAAGLDAIQVSQA